MRWGWLGFFVALAIVAAVGVALGAPSGDSQQPLFTRQSQFDGTPTAGFVNCSSSLDGTPIITTATGCRSIMFRSQSANPVYICKAAICNSANSGIYLEDDNAVTLDWSAGGAWSCIGSGGSATIRYYAECGQ